MNKKTSEFAGRVSDVAAAVILLAVLFGAGIYSAAQDFGGVIKRKIQMINGGMER